MTSSDVLVKVSTEASTAFVRDYYHSLQSRKNTIANYYVQSGSLQGGKAIPTIVYNGTAIPDGHAVQAKFENELPHIRLDAQSIDCHILNPQYIASGSPPSRSVASTMTLLVMVNGIMRFGEGRNNPESQFSETLVLVPNQQRNPRDPNSKNFLIQSQNFRTVVN